MKILRIQILLLFILAGGLLAQERPSGEFEVCYDDSSSGSACLNILINEDYSYSLQVRFPNEIKTETGCWNMDGDKITLTPEGNEDYYDLHNSLLDKLLPGRILEIKEDGLQWKMKDKPALVLKKIRKCNC